MQPRIADELIGGLECRIKGLPNPEDFVAALERTEVAQSKRFYEPLPLDPQLIQDGEQRYHMVSIRRILRNRNAYEQHLAGPKKWWANMVFGMGVYSSNVLTRQLRTNPAVVGLLQTADAPYSLLAKVETFKFDNPQDQLFIITKPMLIIPGKENSPAVHEWEDSVAKFEEERFSWRILLGSRQVRISRATYEQRQRQLADDFGYVA